jgi:phosphoribosylamine--glycine ligase
VGANDVDENELFNQALAAAQAGQRAQARRVLAVTGTAATVAAARHAAYEAVARLSWPGCHYRSDIGAGTADR